MAAPCSCNVFSKKTLQQMQKYINQAYWGAPEKIAPLTDGKIGPDMDWAEAPYMDEYVGTGGVFATNIRGRDPIHPGAEMTTEDVATMMRTDAKQFCVGMRDQDTADVRCYCAPDKPEYALTKNLYKWAYSKPLWEFWNYLTDKYQVYKPELIGERVNAEERERLRQWVQIHHTIGEIIENETRHLLDHCLIALRRR